MTSRRASSILDAMRYGEPFFRPIVHEPKPYHPPPLKMAMMIHFATVVGPFAPEVSRTSPAYTKFIKQLLREGMVHRPTKAQRRDYPGWAYMATAKGRAYVEALRHVQIPVPVEHTIEWTTELK